MDHVIVESGPQRLDALALALSHLGEARDMHVPNDLDPKVLDAARAHVPMYGRRCPVVALGAVSHNRAVRPHAFTQLLPRRTDIDCNVGWDLNNPVKLD